MVGSCYLDKLLIGLKAFIIPHDMLATPVPSLGDVSHASAIVDVCHGSTALVRGDNPISVV